MKLQLDQFAWNLGKSNTALNAKQFYNISLAGWQYSGKQYLECPVRADSLHSSVLEELLK